MTKVQRARLLVLQSLAAAELTAAQKTELDSLNLLAAAHPDATKDTDAPAAAVVTAAAKPAATGAAATARTVILAAVNSLRSRGAVASDLATLQTQVGTLTTERDTLRAANAALNAQVDAFAAFLGVKSADLACKDLVALNALMETKLQALLIEHVASLGLPVGELPKQPAGEGAANTLEEARAELAAEKDPVKAGILAAKVIKLRDAAWGKN